MTVGNIFHRDAAATANEQSPALVRVRFTSNMLLFAERSVLVDTGVADQNVERSRTSKVSGSCQKVSGSWRRLARRYATSSNPERRSTYAHARRTGVTSGGRSNLTLCQNVETEFMTPAATVLHNKSFLRAAAATYFSTPYVAHSSAHVFLSFLCTTTTMARRYVKLLSLECMTHFP